MSLVISNRQVGPAGITSPTVSVPAGITYILAQLSSPQWGNTAGTFTWSIDRSLDGGTTWATILGPQSYDVLALNPRTGLPPAIGIQTDTLGGAGTLCRVSASCTVTITISVDVTTS